MNNVEEYLFQLKQALQGSDSATQQDALAASRASDASALLTSAGASTTLLAARRFCAGLTIFFRSPP